MPVAFRSAPITARITVLTLLFVALPPALPATAQGIFDLPPMTGASGAAAPAPASAADRASLDFTVSPELRATNQKAFLDALRSSSPDAADQMAGHDLIALMAAALEPHGLAVDNVGDAFTAWLMINHSLVTGDEADPTQAQVDGTRDRFTAMLLQTPQLIDVSDAEKQAAAEQFLLQALLNQGMVDAVKETQPEGLPGVRQQIAQASIEMGLDLSLLEMTETGLAPR